MKNLKYASLILFGMVLGIFSCDNDTRDHKEMIHILEQLNIKSTVPTNMFSSIAKLKEIDSLLSFPHNFSEDIYDFKIRKSKILLELGREIEAIRICEEILPLVDSQIEMEVLKTLGIAYLRKGERDNCIMGHAAESCIIPMIGMGIHQNKTGSERAIEVFQKILEKDSEDIESKWLLNIAHLTLEATRRVILSFIYLEWKWNIPIISNRFWTLQDLG